MPENLNPEGVVAAADVTWMYVYQEHGVCDADRATESYRVATEAATEALSAYFAALPSPRPGTMINTVEELDQLPVGSVIVVNDTMLQATDRDDYGTMWSRVCDIDAYQSEALALPATVLWVPTEGGRDAT